MTSPGFTVHDRQGHRLGTLTAASVLGWLTIIAPALVVVERILTPTADTGIGWWPAIVVVLLAVASADLPDGSFPLLTIIAAASWWIAVVEQPTILSTLVVALALLAFHLATALAATGAPGREVDAAVLRALAGRAAAVGSATGALALVAAAAQDRVDAPPVLLGLALLGVAALPWFAGRWQRPGPGH